MKPMTLICATERPCLCCGQSKENFQRNPSMDIRDVKDWIYRAEGNLHVIIANEKTKQVLRLLKCPKDRKIYDCSEYRANDATESELCFIRHIAHPLMQSCTVCFPIQKAFVSKEFLKMISRKIESDRPKVRINKVIDQTLKFGILMPDFCQILPPAMSTENLPISVEIKPKQGFILIGDDRCKYSQFQQVKVQNKTYDRLSTYCPVDLFSGSKKRMHKALRALLSDPQNNLRVFRGGDVIFSQELIKQSKHKGKDFFMTNVLPNMLDYHEMPSNRILEDSLSDFQDLVCDLLLCSVSKSRHTPHTSHYCERHSSLEAKHKTSDPCNGSETECKLPADCVLGLLLTLQKLESHSIEEYYEMYTLVQNHLKLFPGDRTLLTLEGPYDAQCWKDLVEEVKGGVDFEAHSCDDWRLDVSKAASILRKFLIATSFKDCSIIMTFQRKSSDDVMHSAFPTVIKGRSGLEYWASVAVVDSDPKPASRIPGYYRSLIGK